MTIEIIAATQAEQHVFRNLFQFYLYDFSEIIDLSVESHGANIGRFSEGDLDGCWSQPQRFAFLLKVDEEYAGCAIVDDLRLAPDPQDRQDLIDLAEFFVMRKFRRRGVGKAFAFALFERFRGRWRVGQIAQNTKALAFWRKVISEYTHEQFEETTWQSKTRHGTHQFFDNGKPTNIERLKVD